MGDPQDSRAHATAQTELEMPPRSNSVGSLGVRAIPPMTETPVPLAADICASSQRHGFVGLGFLSSPKSPVLSVRAEPHFLFLHTLLLAAHPKYNPCGPGKGGALGFLLFLFYFPPIDKDHGFSFIPPDTPIFFLK